MQKSLILAMALGASLVVAQPALANGPSETMIEADQVLGELLAIPGKQIPQRLLDEAQGVAIIPNVLKIGFIAGARRGHGVVMVRDAEGEWSLPQFITLTGGSVGWQAGIQGTDVVLVFTTRRGIEGLMSGKFTIGVDASASAGPVGREAGVGTDPLLRSEIYTYSRSRGLFVGVSLDGSALEIDHEAHAFYYGSQTGELPRRVPPSAAQLRSLLADVTPGHVKAGGPERPQVGHSPRQLEAIRRSLVQNSSQLQSILAPEWRPYLALPREIYEPGAHPNHEAIANTLKRFAHVNSSPEYKALIQRPEFQTTFELLREYEQATMGPRSTLELPPPPNNLGR